MPIRKIIRSLNKNNGRAAKAAVELGIHRSTAYRWARKAERRHLNKETVVLVGRGLKRQSTRPRNIHRKLTATDESAICAFRKLHGCTAEKIRAHLNLPVHWRTVHRFLKCSHNVREHGYHRRPKFQDTLHMHLSNTPTVGYLQMDVKVVTPELSGLPWTCYEYAAIDIFSRYKEAVILNQLDQDGAISALLEIIPKLPFKPVFIQTDNGLEFQQRFRDACTRLGLKYHYVHKNSPNENAIIERSFRTDEEEFFFRMERRPAHYDELRRQFADYLKYYNYERYHLGINLKTPYQVVANVLSD